jgi:hypothetical protein
MDMAPMYKEFRGADPNVKYLLEEDGLVAEKPVKAMAKKVDAKKPAKK